MTMFDRMANNILHECNSKKTVKHIIFQEEKKQEEKKQEEKKQEDVPAVNVQQNKPQEQKEQTPKVQMNEKENQFLQKFIKYSELIYLNDSTDKIIQDFKRVLGPANDATAVEMINKNKADRDQEIAKLSKQLNGLRQSIQDEAQKAEAKVSLLELLGKEQKQQPIDPIDELLK